MNDSAPVFAIARSFDVAGARLEFVQRVRLSGRDDQQQSVVRFESAVGGEPLRDQLRRARAGEAVLLGSQRLFDEESPFREYGPIYVSAELARVTVAPEALFSGDYFRSELVLRRYDHRRYITNARRVQKEEATSVVEEWLAQEDTAFVDARFPEYGCFACRFARTQEAATTSTSG